MMNRILFLMLLTGLRVYSQEYVSYTVENGLPSNHVYNIKQDAEGFMWFATNRGIAKFDGTNFKVFTIKDGLPNNDIWLLEMDTEGRLWYFSASNFQGYIKNDSVYRFSTQNKEVINPKYFYPARGRVMYTSNKGIYDLRNDTLERIFNFSDVQKDLKRLNISSDDLLPFAFPSGNEMLYIITEPGKLTVKETDGREKFSCEVQNVQDWALNVRHLAHGKFHHDIYFYASSAGITLLDVKNETARYFLFENLLESIEIRNLFHTSNSSEIQFSVSGALIIFDYQLKVKEIIEVPETLSSIRSFKDKDGNVWTTDLKSGVKMVSRAQLESKKYFTGEKVEAVGVVNGQLFAGINNSGFYAFGDQADNEITPLFYPVDGQVYGIKNDRKNKASYLVSTYEAFVIKNHNGNPSETRSEIALSQFLTTRYKSIAQLDGYWYMLDHYGVHKHDIYTYELAHVYVKEGLFKLEVYNEKVFVGASNGLFIIDHNELIRPVLDNNLLTAPITCMETIGDYLFVGTNGKGVYVYHDLGTVHIKSTNGLMIQKICVQKNIMWLATENGIRKIRLNSKYPESVPIVDAFYRSDGLIQNNLNDICLDNGFLLAATDNGISRIDPNNSLYREKPDLRINVLNDTLEVLPGERQFISISFFVLNYVNQRHYKYYYRLNPVHNDWIEAPSKTLNFSALAPQLYKLEIKVIDQHSNTTIGTLYINVLPAWWETDFAKASFGLFLLGLLYFIYRLILSNVRRKEAKKNQLKRNMASVKLQALRSQMNPHFVHNSLNAILYFIQHKDVYQSENYLTKFSRLIRLFFDYSQKEHITIRQEIDLIQNYLVIEHLRFEHKLEYEISVDPRLNIEEQVIPTMILQPIVENAVNHGVFHKTANGKIRVNFLFEDASSFRIIVEDNGVGIEAAEAIKIKSNRNYHSSSSEVLKDRLKLLREKREWEIVHIISNLTNNTKEPGTKVELYFKHI